MLVLGKSAASEKGGRILLMKRNGFNVGHYLSVLRSRETQTLRRS
jgi:hypothetical protein